MAELSLFPAESSAGKIIDHLQRNGEATVRELEEVLGVSTTAVREHLTHLQSRDLLATRQVRRGPGRPALVYYLTPTARNLVPKSYDTLISMLMQEISSREGPDQLQNLLDAVGERMAEQYRGLISGEDLKQRLDGFRSMLEERGIPTEVHADDGKIKFFACPYFDVAQEHAGVCAMERKMLEQLLGASIQLEGTIREGQRNCQFHIGQNQLNSSVCRCGTGGSPCAMHDS